MKNQLYAIGLTLGMAIGFGSCKSEQSRSDIKQVESGLRDSSWVPTNRAGLLCYSSVDEDDTECKEYLESRNLRPVVHSAFRTYILDVNNAIVDVEAGREYITLYDYINGERVKKREQKIYRKADGTPSSFQ